MVMRNILVAGFGLVLAACGPAVDGNGGEAAAQGGGGEAAFVQDCVARYVAQNAQARQWAPDQCAQEWGLVVAAAPMANAILAGAGGTMPAPGRASGLDVEVNAGARTAVFSWSAVGEPVPFDVVSALAQRGATLAMIGCSQLGAGEFSQVYRVAASGGAPFQLGIYARNAPTADASSFYTVTADFSGRIQTRAQLASDGSEWTAACAY